MLAECSRFAGCYPAGMILLIDIFMTAAVIQVVHGSVILADKIRNTVACVAFRILFSIARATSVAYGRGDAVCFAARVRLGYGKLAAGIADVVKRSIAFIRNDCWKRCVIIRIEFTIGGIAVFTRCKLDTGCRTARMLFKLDGTAAKMRF